jgi:hypothetical protein
MVLSRRLEAMRHGLSVRPQQEDPTDSPTPPAPMPPQALGTPTRDVAGHDAYIATAPTAAAENLPPGSLLPPGSDEYRLADADPAATAPNVHKALRSDLEWGPDLTAAASVVKPSPNLVRQIEQEREAPVAAAPSGPKFTTVGADDHRRYEELEEEGGGWIALQTWILMACAAAVALGFWYIMQPPTLDRMYQRVMQAEDRGQLADAETDIKAFLDRCEASDPRGRELEQLRDRIETDRLNRKIERLLRGRGKENSLTPIDRDYAEALKQVELDPEAGMRRVQALVDLYGNEDGDESSVTRQCLELARRKLKELRDSVKQYADDHLVLIERQLDYADKVESTAPKEAEKIRRAVVELYDGKPWAKAQVERARSASAARRTNPPTQTQ